MSEGNELIKFDDAKSIAQFLQQPAIKLAEFITGILISDRNDWKLSAGRLVQASIKWKLFTQLGKELNDYIKKGKIKEDFLNDDQHKQSLSDLLKFIDDTAPSEDRFKAMKALFIKSALSDSSQEEQSLAYQFMKICSSLESNDLLILKAAHDIKDGRLSQKLAGTNPNKDDMIAESWFRMISRQIGHEIKSLIEVNEDNLVNLKLIAPRTGSDRSGIRTTKNYRLTDLGCKLCEYIYDSDV